MRLATKAYCSAMLTLAVAATAPDAAACGGTFCDTGPQAMPVDQTGENVLFVMGDGIVEAHVQIQYQGDPEKFAWVVPMQGQDIEVSVGSQILFDRLLQGTVPSYGFSTVQNQCSQPRRGGGGASNFLAPSADAADEGKGVDVLLRETVGSFDVEIVEAESADTLVEWLETEEYQNIDTAPAIFQRYVDKGFVFVAIKLTAGAGVNEIHPLTFTYSGGEPCVPLELTAVAAVEDMGVRTFFLGRSRAVPTNYRHVLVNPLKIDWLNFGANYREVISEAVDVEHADGQAFVTEYAGPSSVVAGGLRNEAWDASRFEDIAPELAMAELEVQGLAFCDGACSFTHPLIQPLLQEYLPRPTGVSDEAFYSCVECYEGQWDAATWDPQGFSMALQEQVIAPAAHADEILADNPYLTRLFTLISPYEMTLDPMFEENPELSDVPLPGLGTQRIQCDGTTVFEMPDGRQVALGNSGQWPAFEDMPAAEEVQEFRLSGEPTVLVSHTQSIRSVLSTHNDALGLGNSEGCGCSVPGRSASAPAGAVLAGLLAMGWLGRRRERR